VIVVFGLEAIVLVSSVCPLVNEDKRPMPASGWEGLAAGKMGVLLWWAGLCSVKFQSKCLLMGGAVLPPG